ncbi:MAG: hypothetical protein J7L59_00035, partial [Nanoarchaeota archaeon]|nr:hypothetical protein [Nanoarchaeota archaeon]
MGKKRKESKRKGKRKPSKRPHSAKWKMYVVEGGTIKRRKFCPKCGPGVFLA